MVSNDGVAEQNRHGRSIVAYSDDEFVVVVVDGFGEVITVDRMTAAFIAFAYQREPREVDGAYGSRGTCSPKTMSATRGAEGITVTPHRPTPATPMSVLWLALHAIYLCRARCSLCRRCSRLIRWIVDEHDCFSID